MAALCWKDSVIRFVWKIMTEGVRPTYIQDGRNTTEGDGGGVEAEKKNVERWDTGVGWKNRGRPHRGS